MGGREPGFARREPKRELSEGCEEEEGSWGKHGFPYGLPAAGFEEVFWRERRG
jgi:hypothetical protein